MLLYTKYTSERILQITQVYQCGEFKYNLNVKTMLAKSSTDLASFVDVMRVKLEAVKRNVTVKK